MRKKLGIDRGAATLPKKFGMELAAKLNFSPSESDGLWWLAEHPKYVIGEFDEERKTGLLEVIARRPEDSFRLIQAIRRKRDQKLNAVIRNALLWGKPPGIELSLKEVAIRVCEKLNQKNLTGKAFEKLVDNIKTQRRDLAKKFPLLKEKYSVS